jgi:hypothetical protein
LVNLGKLAPAPGSGSGLEDSDPFVDQILRPKDPDPDSVGFGFVPSTTAVCWIQYNTISAVMVAIGQILHQFRGGMLGSFQRETRERE